MTLVGHVTHARTFRSLRDHRNYRLYFLGQIVSISGTWMQNAAQAWLVLQLTHSAAAVGVLAVCQFAPYALFGLAGGVIADRLDRRRTLLVTQSIPIVFASVLAALAISGRAQVWEVDMLAVLYGAVLIADTPARQAFTVEMVGRDELPNAVALNSSLFNASRIIGPGIGGVVISLLGVGACFAFNAVSYLAVLASLLLMDPAQLHRDAHRRRPTIVRGIREGLSFAMRTPPVRVIVLMLLFVGTISINFNVLTPVIAAQTLHGGPNVLGLLSACFGVGALCGALLSASLRGASFRVLLAGELGLGVTELLLALQSQVAATALLLAACGAAFSLYGSNSNATLQLLVPDHLRGRVLALYGWVFFGTAPVGGFLAGWLSERGGTGLALTAAGLTAVASSLAGSAWWWGSTQRRLRARPPRAETETLAAR